MGGEIFRTCPDQPWGPPSLLYNGYLVFPGGKERPGRDADPSPPSSAVVKKRKSYNSTPPRGRTACTEPQCLYKGALYLRSTRLLCPHWQISSRHLNVRNSLWLSNVRIQNCGKIPAFSISEACELHYTKTTITSKSQNNAFPSFDRSLIMGQRLLNKSGHSERISTEKSMLKLRFENWHIRNVNDNRTLHQKFYSCCGWRAIQTSSWILESSDIWSPVQCSFVTNVQEKLATHTAGILRPPWKRKQQGSPKVNNQWPTNTGPYSIRLHPSFRSLPAQQYWARSDTEVNSYVNEISALTCVKCQNCVKNFRGLIEGCYSNFNLQSGIGVWSINVAKCAKRPSN